MLFAIWSDEPFRSTGDLDLLGYGTNDPADLQSAFAGICHLSAPELRGFSPPPTAMLVTAVTATFQQRGTALPASFPAALTPAFADRSDKQAQWSAFLRRTTPVFAPPSFVQVIEDLRYFVEPVILASSQAAEAARGQWAPNVGWG